MIFMPYLLRVNALLGRTELYAGCEIMPNQQTGSCKCLNLQAQHVRAFGHHSLPERLHGFGRMLLRARVGAALASDLLSLTAPHLSTCDQVVFEQQHCSKKPEHFGFQVLVWTHPNMLLKPPAAI